jgi:methyltransferase (TIGR00027 family)
MEPGRASGTALWAAYFRAYHSEHGAPPKIFDDSLAGAMLGQGETIEPVRAQLNALTKLLMTPEDARESLETRGRGLLRLFESIDPEVAAPFPDEASALAWAMRTLMPASLMLSRARFAEDRLAAALARETSQYVILGAGMDTFAFRRPDLLDRLRVFEVDHPATQAMKRRRIAEIGWRVPPQLHFVPVDFSKEDFATALARAPFDRRSPTFFSWLGVTCYLPRQAVLATLRAIAQLSPPGSGVVFDFVDEDGFDPERCAPRVKFHLPELAGLGEPVMTGLDPAALAADLDRQGLQLEEHLSPSGIQARYLDGRKDGYRAWEHAHIVSAVVG